MSALDPPCEAYWDVKAVFVRTVALTQRILESAA